ncbi:MAG: hypothetical protein HN931_04935 [Desulfobacterales bacterium]|jgi:hypothetical protein|nr:hypothetical protein [Desulfobacteraceae bacterium]MBT4365192.1 hypothetical protein [Desulfobacteraceae bacterium]MBT7085498.1 hypothetical protein [Desulfobacterales bacterium]
MIIFDGEYEWDGNKNDGFKPVSWWPGACRLTIIDISEKNPGIHILRPVIVLASKLQEGFSVKNRYQDLVRRICLDFKLDMKKVLWIGYNPNIPKEMEAAVFEHVTSIGSEELYSIRWRPVRSNEFEAVKQYL